MIATSAGARSQIVNRSEGDDVSGKKDVAGLLSYCDVWHTTRIERHGKCRMGLQKKSAEGARGKSYGWVHGTFQLGQLGDSFFIGLGLWTTNANAVRNAIDRDT